MVLSGVLRHAHRSRQERWVKFSVKLGIFREEEPTRFLASLIACRVVPSHAISVASAPEQSEASHSHAGETAPTLPW